MYYRGAVENNNVKFANFCWKIVRTTETGGIKLIYNGTPDENGACNATGGETMLQNKSLFNKNTNENIYMGYMYGSIGSSTYEETHANINDSIIKTYIDTWYQNNLLSYTSSLEDTVWCNDRTVVQNTTYTGTGVGTEKTLYGAGSRVYLNTAPSLKCANKNDQFTVSKENGNGALTYPVALLTADEIVYAGGVYAKRDNNYYLYNGNYWWCMSPSHFDDSLSYVFRISQYGYPGYGSTVGGEVGVRPAISLKAGTTAISGDGTSTNPYVIE